MALLSATILHRRPALSKQTVHYTSHTAKRLMTDLCRTERNNLAAGCTTPSTGCWRDTSTLDDSERATPKCTSSNRRL